MPTDYWEAQIVKGAKSRKYFKDADGQVEYMCLNMKPNADVDATTWWIKKFVYDADGITDIKGFTEGSVTLRADLDWG